MVYKVDINTERTIGEHVLRYAGSILESNYYFIDGFRAGFIGYSDEPVINGIIVCIVLNTILFFLTYKMFQTGYKLRT